MEPTIDVISKTTYIFFIYLLMAVFVERAVEVFISIFNYYDMKWKRYKAWNNRAEKYRDKYDRLYNYDPSTKVNKMFSWILWGVITEPTYTDGKYIISAHTIRIKHLQFYSRVCANLVAFILVLTLYYVWNITMIDAVLEVVKNSKDSLNPTVSFLKENTIFGIIATTVAVAAGVEPLHKLIGKVENVGKQKS